MNAKAGYVTDRIDSVEWLRIIGAFGVVWFHNENASARVVGESGLQIFLMIFYSLIARMPQNHSLRNFLSSRFRRLLMPWLFWSLVYGLCKLAKGAMLGDLPAISLNVNTLLTGTIIHLWYLPYAFLTALLVFALNRWTRQSSNIVVISVSTVLGIIILFYSSILMHSGRMASPFWQWIFSFAALPFGFAIGRCCRLTNQRTKSLFLFSIFSMVLTTCLWLKLLGYEEMVIPYSISAALVCGAFQWHGYPDRFSHMIAPLTYGIYLMHPLVSRLIIFLNIPLQPMQKPWSFIISVFLISALLTFIMKRTYLKKFV